MQKDYKTTFVNYKSTIVKFKATFVKFKTKIVNYFYWKWRVKNAELQDYNCKLKTKIVNYNISIVNFVNYKTTIVKYNRVVSNLGFLRLYKIGNFTSEYCPRINNCKYVKKYLQLYFSLWNILLVVKHFLCSLNQLTDSHIISISIACQEYSISQKFRNGSNTEIGPFVLCRRYRDIPV